MAELELHVDDGLPGDAVDEFGREGAVFHDDQGRVVAGLAEVEADVIAAAIGDESGEEGTDAR